MREAIRVLERSGARTRRVSLPHTDAGVATYYIVAPAEASSNLARYDGVQYGLRVADGRDLVSMTAGTRAAGFGPEVRRRIMLGTYVLSAGYYDAYYAQAQRVRTLIRRDFERAFAEVDAIVSPTAPTPAFKLGEKTDDPIAMYLNDVFTIPAPLAGVPAISVPCGFSLAGLPIGLQVIAKPFDEATLFRVAGTYEAACRRAPAPAGARARPRGGRAMSPAWETVIGLEVHAQLLTRSKMFCGCATAFGAPPNHQTCPVCQGMPGILPVINRRAIEFGVRTARALHCRINGACRFARKHYFYPDMPKNYQISQYEAPLAEDGWLEIELDAAGRRIGIERLHLEEDVGKLTHEGGVFETASASLVDFNRAGVPLMEIVSRPDLRSPAEAAEYLRSLRAILRYLGVCDGNMEEGSLRCDANVSVRRSGTTELGTKVEIKNMNSFRHVRDALEHEAARQARALERGERVVQETRLWNPERDVTAADALQGVRARLPLLPRPRPGARGARRGLGRRDRARAPRAPARAPPTLRVGVRPPPPRRRAPDGRPRARRLLRGGGARPREPEGRWRTGSGPSSCASSRGTRRPSRPPPSARRSLARLVALVDEGTISGKMAKELFERMARTGEDPDAIVRREGLRQVADEGAIGRVIDEVVAAHPSVVEDFRRGKKQAAGFLVGQVMKATQGKANPQVVNRLLAERLGAG